MSSVKVAVRCRPFNQREKDMNARLIIEMVGNQTKIENPADGQKKEFAFDYSYWSHDGFNTDEAGYMSPQEGSKYSDQDKVFNDIGLDVLNNAFQGYNACLFAYGQTGSGKSYSIVGYGANKGIVPRSCAEIFKRIKEKEADPNNNIKHEVVLSMMEIYNERIQDLLIKPNKRPQNGMNIREHPKIGVYVEGVVKVPVASYEDIEAKIDEGTSNRTIGATNMNATSSRAHTVTSINFTQKFMDKETGKVSNTKTSDINLIDLAGSERAGSTGATGDRLAEGAMINQSLSILGKVISALAKKATEGKKSSVIVPYRESKLTFLLKNALGGNTKTSMIAALSPASVNFDETLSTLRYAWQVKAIKNVAVVNESPQEKMIRELKEEIDKLKKGGGGAGGGAGMTEEERQEMEQTKALMEQIQKEKAEFQAKLEQAQKDNELSRKQNERIQKFPFLKNINQDPSMTGMVKIAMNDGDNIVGKKNKDFDVDIEVAGVGIANRHSNLNFNEDSRQVKVIPNSDDSEKFKIKVNGQLVSDPVVLNHGDRVLVGNHHYFLFVDPLIDSDHTAEWEDAMKEANADQLQQFDNGTDEMVKELKEREEKLKKEAEEKQAAIEKQMQEMEAARKKQEEELEAARQQMLNSGNEEQQKKLQDELQKQKDEFAAKLREQEEQLEAQKRKAAEDLEQQMKSQMLEQEKIQQFREIDARLQEAIPKIAEVNNICQELNRDEYLYEPEITTEVQPDGRKISRVVIKVYPDKTNRDVSSILPFSIFQDEVYYSIKDLYEKLQDEDAPDFDEDKILNDKSNDGETFGFDKESDWHLIGNIYYFLMSLSNLVETKQDETPIIDNKGSIQGKIGYATGIEVVEPSGVPVNLMEYEGISDLIGKKLKFTVELKQGKDFPEKYCNEIQAKYYMFPHMEELHQTPILTEKSRSPNFNYKHTHELEIEEDMVAFLLSNTLTIGIYGRSESKSSKKIKDQDGNKQLGTINEEGLMFSDDEDNKGRNQKVIQHEAVNKGGEKGGFSQSELEKIKQQNKELQAQIERLKAQGGAKSGCCTIF